MNHKLQELLTQIKTTISENNIGLEDNRLTNLNQRCESIADSLNRIDNILDQIKNSSMEVASEDLPGLLSELNLTEITGESLRTKLEEILSLATNQELADKIKDTEKELETILTTLQNQQTLITNYQNQITTLETKIRSNENQARALSLKAGLIGASVTSLGGGLVYTLVKYLRRINT